MELVIAKIRGYEELKEITIEDVKSGRISEEDIVMMWCSYCGLVAHIYHYPNGTLAFRCKKHRKDCSSQKEDELENERLILKKKKIYTNTTLNNDLILYGNDRAPNIKVHLDTDEPEDDIKNEEENNIDLNGADINVKESTSEEKTENAEDIISNQQTNELLSTPDDEIKKEEAYYYEFGEKNIACTSSLFKEIKAHGHEFNMGDGRTAADLLLDDIALHTIRRQGFEGIKIALLTRPNKDDIEFLKKNNLYYLGGGLDYTILKDAYSTNPENTLYFKVRCKNIEQNEYFKNLVMGSKLESSIKKDERKYIVIYAVWKRIVNDFVSLYMADITFRQYAFVKDITIGNRYV